MTKRRPFVIGLGSPHGDDQAGWLVVEALQQRGWSDREARNISQPIDLIDLLPDPRPLLLCDAASDRDSTGRCRRWIWPDQELPTSKPSGSHNLPLAGVLELARKLNVLNGVVELRTIDGSDWTSFAQADANVAAAARKLAATIDLAAKINGESSDA